MLYFSLATLVLGIVGALYLLLEWISHGRRRVFALLWSIGLLLLYWFQVPAILFHARESFTLTDFNLFFSFAFPATFVGSLFIYSGILSVTKPPGPRKKTTLFLCLWAAAAIILFSFYFANQNTITNYSSALIFTFGFFVPLHILSLTELWRWYKKFDWPPIASLGTLILVASFLIRIFQDIFALSRSLQFPPEFWFLAIANSSALFIMQALGTLLLLVGFFFTHRSCCARLDGAAGAQRT